MLATRALTRVARAHQLVKRSLARTPPAPPQAFVPGVGAARQPAPGQAARPYTDAMERERELKFSLLDPPPDDALLVDAFRGSGFALEPRGTRRQRDEYLDTPEGALRAAGVALRRREVDGVRLATLKTLGRVSGPYHERDELELPLPADGGWPATLLARAAQFAPFDPAALTPQVLLHTARRVFAVRDQGAPVAELCFDDVSARAPGEAREALFLEAELEAAPGVPQAQLEAIVARLERVVALTPSGVTKLQRAEALLALGALLE